MSVRMSPAARSGRARRQRRLDLTVGALQNIGTLQTGNGSALLLSDSASGLARCFHRVLLGP